MSTKTIIIILVGALVILGGISFFLFSKGNKEKVQKTSNTGQTQIANTTITIAPIIATSTPIPIPAGTLFVTSDGIAPSKIEVKVGSALIITNNTITDVIIKMSGALNKDIVAPAQKTIKTEIINNSGEVKASLPGSRSNSVTITIK